MSTTVETRTTAPPDRSLAQRMTALERANAVRSARAQLKVDILAGRQDPVEILLSPPPSVDSMKVFDLLLATPKVGRSKALKRLAHAGISPVKTVGGMTMRQRKELALLSGWEPGEPAIAWQPRERQIGGGR
jgi:hypothetical protein